MQIIYYLLQSAYSLSLSLSYSKNSSSSSAALSLEEFRYATSFFYSLLITASFEDSPFGSSKGQICSYCIFVLPWRTSPSSS